MNNQLEKDNPFYSADNLKNISDGDVESKSKYPSFLSNNLFQRKASEQSLKMEGGQRKVISQDIFEEPNIVMPKDKYKLNFLFVTIVAAIIGAIIVGIFFVNSEKDRFINNIVNNSKNTSTIVTISTDTRNSVSKNVESSNSASISTTSQSEIKQIIDIIDNIDDINSIDGNLDSKIDY